MADGIYKKLTEEANQYSTLTTKSLEEIFREIEESLNRRPREPQPITLPASDYPSMSDQEFTNMVTMKGVRFMGGSEGCDRMMERCKRLNIPVN